MWDERQLKLIKAESLSRYFVWLNALGKQNCEFSLPKREGPGNGPSILSESFEKLHLKNMGKL